MAQNFLSENKIKLIFILTFFTIGFCVEFAYRKPLFDNSVKIAESVQEPFSKSITFWKYWAYFGVGEFVLAAIIFLFFPISYCFTFFANMIITVHLCNYAKLIYSQGRPYLLDDTVYKACEAGYGNPSGHSFQFTANLLAFAQMFIDLFKLKKIYSIIIYVICGILILSINFSRIVLGVHSINQVIFGDTLGFTVYFIICQIIKPHNIELKKFFEVFLTMKFHIIHVIAFIINMVSIVIGGIVNDKMESEEYEKLKEKIEEICGSAENAMLSRDSITKALYITAYYGMICGMTLLIYFVKNRYHQNYNELNYYYRNSKYKWYATYTTRLLFTAICYIPFLSIYSKKGVNIYLIYVIGSAFPMFVFGFMLFSINYILSIIFLLANSDIYLSFEKEGEKKAKTDEYLLGENEVE